MIASSKIIHRDKVRDRDGIRRWDAEVEVDVEVEMKVEGEWVFKGKRDSSEDNMAYRRDTRPVLDENTCRCS